MEDLESLSESMKGISDPNSTKQLTEPAREVHKQIECAIQKQQVCCVNYANPWQDCLLPTNLPNRRIMARQSAFMNKHSHFTS